jgi:streptomycin 6-kinase
MIAISERFRANNAHARGKEGLAWVDALPALIERFQRRWRLALGHPFPNLSFNYVIGATTATGESAVLKLAFPGDAEAISEMEALHVFDGDGICRLLEVDRAAGAMLEERLVPGLPLHTLADEETEVEIASGIMRRLWRPVPSPHPFPTVADWGRAFPAHRHAHGDGSGPLPPHIFDLGERLYRELNASATCRVLLHGDLHHENILSASREPWLAIDPKGIVGDPGFEVGTYLNNHWEELYPGRDIAATLSFRIQRFAELLDMHPDRLRQWGIAFCVLSAVWSAENGGTDWHDAIRNAEVLAALAPDHL